MLDRKGYQSKIEGHLKEWKAELNKLVAKAQQAEATARIEMTQRTSELERRYEEVKSRLEELRQAGDDAWDRSRDKLESTLADFRRELTRVTSDEGMVTKR